MMLRMFISVSLCISLYMFTVSNALVMSKATATVRCENLGLLKPFVIWWQILCKAVCVERLCLNPCRSEMIEIFFMCGNSVLAMGERSYIGRQFVPMSLFGFEMEMIVACFQRCYIVLVFRPMLYMFVRYLMASAHKCLRYLMFIPSLSMELLFVRFEMIDCTYVVVTFL